MPSGGVDVPDRWRLGLGISLASGTFAQGLEERGRDLLLSEVPRLEQAMPGAGQELAEAYRSLAETYPVGATVFRDVECRRADALGAALDYLRSHPSSEGSHRQNFIKFGVCHH